MGLIRKILGLGTSAGEVGGAIERVAEVFVKNRTKSDENYYRRGQASLEQLAAEFKRSPTGYFDDFISGLNRLPRPTLALGTVGLFVYAMANPVAFSIRMQGLDTVPDQLWWLLGAIVSFYFGARELHYKRQMGNHSFVQNIPHQFFADQTSPNNAALTEWYQLNR